MVKTDKSKSKRHKNLLATSTVVAGVVGCSSAAVRMIKSGKNTGYSDQAQRIQVAEMLLEEGANKLIEEVKRIVKF